MRRSKLVGALASSVVAMALTACPASAAVLSPDAPWSGSGTGTTTVVSDGTLLDPKFTYDVAGTSGQWEFKAVAKQTHRQMLEWRYTGFHAYWLVKASIERFVIRDGAQIVSERLADGGPLPARCCTPPSGGFDYSGKTTFDLKAGDTYGFRMTGSHYDTANVLSGTLALKPVVDQPLKITPSIDYGHLHESGWYTTAVDVSWKVEDPDTPIDSTTGCEPVYHLHDTNGRTITCTAVSGGVTKSENITLKIDQESPKLQSVVVKRVHPWGSGKPSTSLGTVTADEEHSADRFRGRQRGLSRRRRDRDRQGKWRFGHVVQRRGRLVLRRQLPGLLPRS